MATNNRGGNRQRKRGTNNNPEGHNQYDRRNPLTTAIGAAAAIGAGVFLWSRRNQISEQIGDLAEQLNEAREARGWGSGTDDSDGPAPGGDGRTQMEIAEEALTLKEIGAATEPGQQPA